MNLDDYLYWLEQAKICSRVKSEAADLLQDALIVAVEKGREDLAVQENKAWFYGVLRNLSAMQARTSARRKARETATLSGDHELGRQDVDGPTAQASQQRFLNALTPASRQVALLALHGLDRQEICSALGISDSALRQRMTAIRRSLGQLPEDLQRDALSIAYASRALKGPDEAEELPLGLLRRALLRHLRNEGPDKGRSLGTHDPSGHLIVIREGRKA